MSNTNRCQVCNALYSKDTEWFKGIGWYHGTESEPFQRVSLGKIPKNVCPICGTPDHVKVVEVQLSQEDIMNKEKHIQSCVYTAKWFTTAMVTILVKKDNLKKLHWSECDNTFLLDELMKKKDKLYDNIYSEDFNDHISTPQELRERLRLATDIGNFAMMIADKADRKLEE